LRVWPMQGSAVETQEYQERKLMKSMFN
jgi:hypothetical protein